MTRDKIHLQERNKSQLVTPATQGKQRSTLYFRRVETPPNAQKTEQGMISNEG
jgi:hypothetical protein